jgi:hypothetical protein
VRIQAVWAQMKEALGQFILPALQSVGDWFSDKKNQEALQGWIVKVGEFSYEIGEKLVTAIQTTLIPFINDTLLPAIDSISAWFADPANQQSIRDWAANFTEIATTIGTAMEGVVSAIQAVSDAWNALPSWVQTALKEVPKFAAGGGLGYVAQKLRGDEPRPITPRAGSVTGGAYAISGGRTTNITVNQTVKTKAEDSVALALRIDRTVNTGR